MKKSLLALAVLGAFAGAASAQSSVTVYGIVDMGITSIDTGATAGSTTGITSGNQSTSRIGFKGTEDLGNGLKANFVLESTIAADTGSAFSTPAVAGAGPNNGIAASAGGFNRLSTVGLSGNFGAVNLGRQVSAIKDAYDAIDPFGDAGTIAPISTMFFNGALASDFGRISNSIKYTSNSFSGFKAQAAYGFGETVGDTGAGSNYGFGAGYANGPLNVQFGYHNQDRSTAAAVQTAENKLTFLGASYDFGMFKLHGAYADTKLETFGPAAETKYRNYMLAASVKVGAAGNLMASYSVNDNRTTANSDAQKAAIMYTYDLSKRTNFYTGYSHTSNDNGSRIGLVTGAPVGESASALAVGVRHKF